MYLKKTLPILIYISLEIVPVGSIDIKSALDLVVFMGWHRKDNTS